LNAQAAIRNQVKAVLRRAGLLPLAFRVHEHAQAFAGRLDRAPTTDDGLPVPPASLRTRVAGTADAMWFVTSGREHAATIREAAAGVGAPLEAIDAILDFGCGCGRVVRHWRGLDARVHGTDHDRPAIEWCSRNLSFGEFEVNALEPPLVYDEATFDLVYAISVFTHTPARLQRAWLEELVRVVKPGAYVLLTTHGEWCADAKLTADEHARFAEGALVVRDDDAGGSNLCAAFHPPTFVREHLAADLVEAEFRPGGGGGAFDQDIWVFRKAV
jgi:SAM-dependent methyltransferase